MTLEGYLSTEQDPSDYLFIDHTKSYVCMICNNRYLYAKSRGYTHIECLIVSDPVQLRLMTHKLLIKPRKMWGNHKMTTYVALVNELLRRMNEVPLDVAGEGFDTVRNVQALAKDAINSSVRLILQDGQEWPFLKTVHTQVLTAGTRQYDFPSSYSSVDWDTFYLKSLSSVSNAPTHLKVISYENYIQNHRSSDDTGDLVLGDGPP